MVGTCHIIQQWNRPGHLGVTETQPPLLLRVTQSLESRPCEVIRAPEQCAQMPEVPEEPRASCRGLRRGLANSSSPALRGAAGSNLRKIMTLDFLFKIKIKEQITQGALKESPLSPKTFTEDADLKFDEGNLM